MIQIPHHIQLNKIRILFNSLPLHTHIYPYTSVYRCIPCIHSTVYHLHLPLKLDYHTMHKRIQACIRTTAYASTHSQAPDHGRAMPGKARKSADTGRSSTRLIWYKPHHLQPKPPKKSPPQQLVMTNIPKSFPRNFSKPLDNHVRDVLYYMRRHGKMP